MAMMSRWSSLAPPPKVLMTASAVGVLQFALERRRRAGARAVLADHFEQFAGDLLSELGAEYLCRRGLAHAEGAGAHRRVHPQVQQLVGGHLRLDPRQRLLHPGLVDDHAVIQRGGLGPLQGLAEQWLECAEVAERGALEVQLVGDQLPAFVLAQHDRARGYADVVVEGVVGGHPRHGVQRLPGVARANRSAP